MERLFYCSYQCLLSCQRGLQEDINKGSKWGWIAGFALAFELGISVGFAWDPDVHFGFVIWHVILSALAYAWYREDTQDEDNKMYVLELIEKEIVERKKKWGR